MARLWGWLATRAASFYILGFMSVLLSGSIWYVQQLRVKAAACEGRADAQVLVDRLTERLNQDIQEEADEAVNEIENAEDECLDADGPDAAIDFLRK